MQWRPEGGERGQVKTEGEDVEDGGGGGAAAFCSHIQKHTGYCLFGNVTCGYYT